MSRNPNDAKPRIDVIDGVPHVILHEIKRFQFCNHYREMGTLGYDIEEFEIKFTIDEIRDARYSINQGTAGRHLRLALDHEDAETEYWFLAEKLGQIAELVGFELKFREKWPQD